MMKLLDDPAYKKLKRDPTTKVKKQISQAIKRVGRNGGIPDRLKRELIPQFSRPPQIYGLPKVHKDGTPLRPIVASVGSPTYKLAKELAHVLSPLTGKTESFVKNSAEFANRIRKEPVTDGDMMVSFDVVSLFTRVPVDDALRSISILLSEDNTLYERTTIDADDICSLTELCLRTTYFQFEDRFFEQIDGAAMGSPLSPIVANLYMETFEKTALTTALVAPRLWTRYVDDTFVIWPYGQDKLEAFHQHLNSHYPQIEFTMEREEDNKISFLDVAITSKLLYHVTSCLVTIYSVVFYAC